MKSVLVLGAGHSAPLLIDWLLRHSEELDARVTVADLDGDAAARRVGSHERGRGIALDFTDTSARDAALAETDLVVNLLPAGFQGRVAEACVAAGVHMTSASYTSPAVRALAGRARENGVVLLTELGLDPGMDLMSAQEIIDRVHSEEGRIEAFVSYGGGLPEPDPGINPLRYCVTWNPRNVVMAGEAGARLLHRGRIRLIPRSRLFRSVWTQDVEGVGPLEAYANRDALSYREIHGLPDVETLVRATFRYPGYCDTWDAVVRLGMADETFEIPDLRGTSFADLVRMFLPEPSAPGAYLRTSVANLLGCPVDDDVLDRLEWLGLFSEEATGARGKDPASALVALLERRLPLPQGRRDLVVLLHDFLVRRPDGARERIRSTLVELGDAQGSGGFTAMARCVGLPLALGTRLVLQGRIPAGLAGPTQREIFAPLLRDLEDAGLRFTESRTPAATDEDLVGLG